MDSQMRSASFGTPCPTAGVRRRARLPNVSSELAVTTVEYALIAAMIFLVIVVAVKQLGSETSKPYEKIGTELGN